MDAKESLKNVLDILHELKKQNITKQTLIDALRGVESRAVLELGLESLEFFGCGDKREELHYTMVIDQATEEKYLKFSDSGISITPKGERFRKAPTAFVLKDDSEENGPDGSEEALLDSLVEKALNDKTEEEDPSLIPATPNPATARSQQMIHLIQAIDRKIPLDDYAEQMQLDFDEVLDTLDALVRRGTQLDISYFVDEVLEKDCQDELFDYFDEVDGDVEKATEEFYGVYQPEEIRLARFVWKK
ncbi:MAG: hypothetical protein IJ064_01750 [Bacteroidaceae bacterium]|nr:hypothetical protein [Bacteroidaceae bacterium]